MTATPLSTPLATLSGTCTLVGFWRFAAEPHHHTRTQSTPGHLIHLVTRGGYHLELSGRSFAISPGMAIWYHDREAVTWRGDHRAVEFLSCGFLLPALVPPPLTDRVWIADAALVTAFTQALRGVEGETTMLGRSLRATAGAATIAALVCARAGTQQRGLWDQAEVLLSRHQGPWDVDALATHLQVSASTLHRACLAQHGTAPGHRLRELRLDFARHLLQQTPLAIAAIAKRAHYGSAQAFARAFRQRYGVAPAQWRQQVHTHTSS